MANTKLKDGMSFGRLKGGTRFGTKWLGHSLLKEWIHFVLLSRGIKSVKLPWFNYQLGLYITLLLIGSRGSTFRSRERPLGRKDSAAVQLGNLLCARALVLIVLCACKGVWWVLEQPMTSTMEYHPLFQKVIKLLGMRKLLVSMARFGGPTDKKTWLYSSISVAFCCIFAILFSGSKPMFFSRDILKP